MTATQDRTELSTSDRKLIDASATIAAWSQMLSDDLKSGTLTAEFLTEMAASVKAVARQLFDLVEG